MEKLNVATGNVSTWTAHVYYTYNIIDSAICQNCHLEFESTAHYLLRCPNYAAHRAVVLSDLFIVIDGDLIVRLKDINDILTLYIWKYWVSLWVQCYASQNGTVLLVYHWFNEILRPLGNQLGGQLPPIIYKVPI